LGRGIALELARIGYDLVLNYLSNQTAAQTTAADCLGLAQGAGQTIQVEICGADISLAADRQALVDFARAHFGHLELLVNNAGITPAVRADLLEGSEASFDRIVSVNVKGPYFLTQLVAKWMIEQVKAASRDAPSPVRHKIITISSVSAYAASINRGEYCMSKAALAMLTPLYAARLAEFGINVYELRPGIMATDMTAPVKERYDNLIHDGLVPIARWGTPEDVGKAAAAIALDLLPFSTGEVLNIDGGFHLRRL
jgi:NAD(P)-dependent dehydrogenase (short-subunit alcohol dehydrogenase family)